MESTESFGYKEFEKDFTVLSMDDVRSSGIVPPKEIMSWSGVCVHHSLEPTIPVDGRDYAGIFNKFHYVDKEYRYGLGYHFVVSWSKSTGHVTQITASHRWKLQMHGSHAINRKGIIDIKHVNEALIGLCIVGNFDKVFPSKQLLDDVNLLIGRICESVGIEPVIYLHREFDYKTCPGTNIIVSTNRKEILALPL